MHAPRPEILIGEHDADQLPLSLAADGVLRYVWHSAFGPMLIEVRDGVAFVNGERVVPVAEASGTTEESEDDLPGVRTRPSLTIVE